MLDVPNYDKFATLEQMGRDRCKIKIGYQHDAEPASKITRLESRPISNYDLMGKLKKPFDHSMSHILQHDYLTQSIEQRIQRKVLRGEYDKSAQELKNLKYKLGRSERTNDDYQVMRDRIEQLRKANE